MTLEPLYELIGPDKGDPSVVQMCWRAALMLVIGLLVVKVAGKRVFGQWGAIDIVIAFIIGSNLSRALTGSAPFLATVTATLLLVVLHSLLTWATVLLPGLGPLLKGRPRRLVKDGQIDKRALFRSGLGENDLIEALRTKQVAGPEQVSEAWLERDGDISVLKRD
jgi:uncharacterized membrane protein YcaP (DUF421 family)